MARGVVGGSLAGKRIAALGLAFKPSSDDVRDSPSLDVCGRLVAEAGIVPAHDPVALKNASRLRPDLRYAKSVSEAAEGADLALLLTEWTEYRSIDPSVLAEVVARRNVIDARCVLDAQASESAGWSLRTVGVASGHKAGSK